MYYQNQGLMCWKSVYLGRLSVATDTFFELSHRIIQGNLTHSIPCMGCLPYLFSGNGEKVFPPGLKFQLSLLSLKYAITAERSIYKKIVPDNRYLFVCFGNIIGVIARMPQVLADNHFFAKYISKL